MHAAFGVSMMVAAAIAASPVAAPREPTRETPVVAQGQVAIETTETTGSLEVTGSIEATVVPDPQFDSFAEYLDWLLEQYS